MDIPICDVSIVLSFLCFDVDLSYSMKMKFASTLSKTRNESNLESN